MSGSVRESGSRINPRQRYGNDTRERRICGIEIIRPSHVGTSRWDVPTRVAAGGTVAPLNTARTAQRAVPTIRWPERRLDKIILLARPPNRLKFVPHFHLRTV